MKKHITAFYIETLVLIVVFVSIILVLTHVFGLARTQSVEAKVLTNAVCIAQNAAEAFSASEGPEELAALLDEGGNTALFYESVSARYNLDMTPNPEGVLSLTVTYRSAGPLLESDISVVRLDTEETVYALETSVFRGEAAP